MEFVVKRDPRTGRDRPQEKDLNDRAKVLRVVPRDANIRAYLKHGITRVGFLAEGSAEWPNDQFTRRRIKEGDVTIEGVGEQPAIEESGAKAQEPEPRRRQQAPRPSETASSIDPDKTTAPHR